MQSYEIRQLIEAILDEESPLKTIDVGGQVLNFNYRTILERKRLFKLHSLTDAEMAAFYRRFPRDRAPFLPGGQKMWDAMGKIIDGVAELRSLDIEDETYTFLTALGIKREDLV